MKIRKWDTVQIISWKTADKGKVAKVLKVLKSENKLLIEGINIATKHMKKVGTQKGQIIKLEKPIDVSNVMLMCPITGKPTRVGFLITKEKGKTKKVRISKAAIKAGKKEKEAIIK